MPPKNDPYATKLNKRIDTLLLVFTVLLIAILLRSSAHGQTTKLKSEWEQDDWWAESGSAFTSRFEFTLTSTYNSTLTQNRARFSDFLDGGRGLSDSAIGVGPNITTTARTWDGGASGSGTSWTTSSGVNWNPDGVPTTSDTLLLDNSVVNIPTTMQIGTGGAGAATITFSNNFNATNTTTIGSNVGTSPILTLGAGWSVTNNATSGTVTFQPIAGGTTALTVNLNGAGIMSVANGGTLAFSTVIADGSSAGAITKTGAGVLNLSGVNSYTGGTTVSLGTLRMSGSGTLGSTSGTLTVNGGTLDLGGTSQTVGALNGTGGTINTSTGTSTLTVGNGGGSGSYGGAISTGIGTTALTKTGSGTQTLSGANAYVGATTINGGTLSLDNNNTTTARLSGTSGITVNSGGTLLLTQSGGTASNNRIANGAAMTINNGGIFNTGGLNEGPTGGAAGSTAAVGALTLASGSTIDFTSANSSNLLFNSLINSAGNSVTIAHWTGSLFLDNGAATNDRLLFINSTGLTTAQLASFQFTDDSGALLGVGAMQIAFNGYFELVPIPEPGTWIAGALAFGVFAYSQRRRLGKLAIAG